MGCVWTVRRSRTNRGNRLRIQGNPYTAGAYCRYIDMAVQRTEQGRQNAAAYELTKQATEAGSNERSPPTPYCAPCTLSVSELP
eukprot:jgi/Chrzof1/2365/Cz11g12130.t1